MAMTTVKREIIDASHQKLKAQARAWALLGKKDDRFTVARPDHQDKSDCRCGAGRARPF